MEKAGQWEPLYYKPDRRRRRWSGHRTILAINAVCFTILLSFYLWMYHWPLGGNDNTVATTATTGSASSFKLKHILHHNTHENPNEHGRLDITNEYMDNMIATELETFDAQYTLARKTQMIRRMVDRDPDFVESYLTYARTTPGGPKPMDFDWIDEEVTVPNITEKDTMLSLAIMAANAYVELPHTGNWVNVTDPWNTTQHIGWMGDGVRGHVFADDSNSTVIIALKGTSSAVFDSGGDTAPNDKINDNLLFSCCCARISYLWNTVCDCYTGDSYTCNQTCLERELYREDRYFKAALDVYRNVSSMYPNSEMWLVGHSLGGALSALVGRTYGIPAVAFEAPPERLASERLHLPKPPGVPIWEDYVYHVGHTADPIYMGVCNGAGSSCWIGGYAMETQCHTGLKCVYDVVEDLGWHVSLINHRIHVVIDDIITQYNITPECKEPPPCKDCFNWKFIDDDAPPPPKTTTSTAATTSSTKPTSTKSPTPTSTKPPQKCLKRTWYGRCIEYGPDLPATTTTTSTTTPTPSSTSKTVSSPPTRTCRPDEEEQCLRRTWYGWCIEYGCI